MAERIFRLASLFIFGLGLVLIAKTTQHQNEPIAQARLIPMFKIQVAHDITPLNQGGSSSHEPHEMAANISTQ